MFVLFVSVLTYFKGVERLLWFSYLLLFQISLFFMIIILCEFLIFDENPYATILQQKQKWLIYSFKIMVVDSHHLLEEKEKNKKVKRKCCPSSRGWHHKIPRKNISGVGYLFQTLLLLCIYSKLSASLLNDFVGRCGFLLAAAFYWYFLFKFLFCFFFFLFFFCIFHMGGCNISVLDAGCI